MTASGAERSGVIIDDAGEALPAQQWSLARRIGCPTTGFDAIAHAVRNLGFVHLAPIRHGLLVTFEPATVCRLAAFAAFYEIAARAPERLILAYPSADGSPDRYEIFNNLSDGLKRVEAALDGGPNAQNIVAPGIVSQGARQRVRQGVNQGGATLSLVHLPHPPRHRAVKHGGGMRRAVDLAVRSRARDCSRRVCRPLDRIPPEDAWLEQLLGLWRGARRRGWRLPSTDALDALEMLNIARGRAHIVDTDAGDPGKYRFRLWASVNSYGGGHANRILAEMPAGSMRDDAIETYWEVVATGVPSYQLIRRMENELSFSYARLLLPLAADGRQVDRLLVLINERLLPELEGP